MTSFPKHKKRSPLWSITVQLAEEVRPRIVVNIALACIFLVDAGLTFVNAVHRLLVSLKLVNAVQGFLPNFSPSSPPPFAQWPMTHMYCRLVHLYNICSGYDESLRMQHEHFSRTARNDWIRDWAYWNGAGHRGQWNAAVPALDSDSRSPCPGLNILASHGIISNTGHAVSASQLVASVSRVFGIAPTMALQLYSPLFARFSAKGHVFALQDVGVVNVIEHDASLLRPDFHLIDWHQDPHAMSRPHQDLIDRFLPLAAKKGLAQKQLTHADFANALRDRRQECKHANRMYTSNITQSLIGAGSCCLMLNVFGGNIADLREMAGTVHSDLAGLRTTHTGQHYGYERIPSAKWQPATATRYFGMTIFEALYTTFQIEWLSRV